jgi:hypothetical protein
VPKIESFTLGAGISDRLHDIVECPNRLGRREASEGVFGCYFAGSLPGIRIGAILHVAVLFTFLDGVGFQQEADRPTP